MAGSWDVWRSLEDGTLTSAAHGFRLVVRPATATAAAVRFGVIRRGPEGDRPVGAGQAENVRAAMKAAVALAKRFARPLRREAASGAGGQ
jgi:hypothetical protein